VRSFQQRDANAVAELVHDDVVEENPQSGARIKGKHNYLSVFKNIPVMPNVIDYRFTLSGDLAIAERTVEYGGNRSYITAIPGEGYRTLKPGTLVRFEVVDSPAGLTARNVQKEGT
jgi:hypothetical protein